MLIIIFAIVKSRKYVFLKSQNIFVCNFKLSNLSLAILRWYLQPGNQLLNFNCC